MHNTNITISHTHTHTHKFTTHKLTLNTHWKEWCWSWGSNTLATWCKEPTFWKRPWSWKDWGQEEKEMTEDEIIGRHHWLNGHELEQTLGDSEGQGNLAYFSYWGCQGIGHDLMTEQQEQHTHTHTHPSNNKKRISRQALKRETGNGG